MELHVLRVFTSAEGEAGNPLGVFLDGSEVGASERQALAHELGFAETVFVDDRDRGALRIFTPEIELPLAGHPLVGCAWLLRETGTAPTVLRPPAGDVAVSFDGELTRVAGDPEWAPPFEFVELASAEQVEALEGPPEGYGWVGVWAWIDRDAGLVRERVFAAEAGVGEDEATGSAAMRLCALIGRRLEIRQGGGSVIEARPLADGRTEIGGRVVCDEVRMIELSSPGPRS